MVDLTAIKQAPCIVQDEHGNEVVQIPLAVWEEAVGHIEPQPSQIEQIMAVIKKWEAVPDDKSQEWWDEFEAFLKANRVHFEERDLGFGDE